MTIIIEARKSVKALFKEEGFKTNGLIQMFSAPEVIVLVGYSSAYGQLFFDIGFFLVALSRNVPNRVENSHIYGRLERLFPELRSEIIDVGNCADAKLINSFVSTFHEHLRNTISPGLKNMANETALTECLLSGKLSHFLTLPAARSYLISRIS